MDNNSNILLDDIEVMIAHTDNLIKHLGKFNNLSSQDIESLKTTVFHIDGVLIKLNNKQKKEFDLVTMNIVQALNEANEHLKKILLHKQDNPNEYESHEHQELSNHLFASLLNHFKKL